MFRAASFRRTIGPAFVGIAWLMAVASGFAVLHRYETTRASAGSPPESWPIQHQLSLETDRLTLVVAIHPQCPCTRATARALEELLADRPGRARLNVLVYQPAEVTENWTSTPTVRTLSALPDARCLVDLEGKLAGQFGALTSGQVLAFDTTGHLLFSGGVTPVRGQLGPNAGYSALAALLDNKPALDRHSPIFGCSILSAPSGRGGKT